MRTYHVTTFGCQMNEHDSERMKGMLESIGYSEVPERDAADLILFNTCSIRESADNRLIGHLGEAKRLKTENPDKLVGVGGCWAQSLKDEVFEQFPFVDVAFGPGQVPKLAEFLTSDSLTAQGFFEFEGFTGHLPARRAREFQGWVQISVGCNCVCAYCIVPSTRGREVSRPARELVEEVERLAADGVREVTLLGQNVNSYGRDLPKGEKATFAELLAMVDAIEGIERIRYTSPHPKDMREDVVRAHAELPSLCEHIHLPLQSGSSRILKAMKRTYNRERYLDRVELIRQHVPGLRADHRHHRRLPGRDRGGVPGDAGGGGRGGLRLRVHVHLLAAPRHPGGRLRGPAPTRGQARAHGAAGGARPAPRHRARPALRGPRAGRPGRGTVAHRPGQAARPHPPQQDRELPRRRRARRAGAGSHRLRHEHDARRRGAPPRARGLSPEAPPVIAIFGPTGVGKTAVALELADLLRERGEDPVAISADALQVYRGLETLTGAAGPDERARLEHRLIAFVEPSATFSVGEFMPLAHAEIDGARSAGRRPIVVGGTGLYLRAALTDLTLAPAPPPELRERIQAELAARGPTAMHQELRQRAPAAAAAIEPTDRTRIVRSLELLELGAEPPPAEGSELWTAETRVPTRLFGLTMDREELYRRIDARVDRMVAAGAADEVRRAADAGVSRTARAALGFDDLLAGDVDSMRRRTRQYAKRQLTWMRKLAGVTTLDMTARDPRDAAGRILEDATS